MTWKSAVNGNWKTAASWSASAVPLATDDVTISRIGNYTVTLDSLQAARSLTFSAIGALFNETSTGSLNLNSGAGILTVNAGTVVLNAANSLGGTVLNGGTLVLGNTGALGSGYLEVNYGTLLATVGMTLNPLAVPVDATQANVHLFLSGDLTIAAAHDVVLDINPTGGWELSEIDDGSSVTFGAPASDGTIIWHTDSNAYIDPSIDGLYGTRVAGGTLQAADDGFGYLFELAAFTQIDDGAMIDLAGYTMATVDISSGAVDSGYVITYLEGEGDIVNSVSAQTAVLAAQGGDFLGTISGNIQLIVAGPLPTTLVLEGTNTYTGGTAISGSGAHLSIDGAGSITGDVLVQYGGQLSLDRQDAYTLDIDLVSVAGASLVKTDIGTATIDGHGTGFSGGVFIDEGTLAITQSDAIGTGLTTIGDLNPLITTAPVAELLGLDTFAFAGSIDLARENATISAATGKTFGIYNAMASAYNDDPAEINFIGSAGHLGTVEWFGFSTTDPTILRSLEIAYGTLQAGDANFASSLANWLGTTQIDEGATLDLNGFDATLDRLRGAGTLTSVAPDGSVSLGGQLNLDDDHPETWFTGDILGNLEVIFTTSAKLRGVSDYTGDTNLGGHYLENIGTFTLNADITGNSVAGFKNWTDFNHDANVASTVDVRFTNDVDGVIDVTAGSIAFNAGFVNAGLVHGVLVRSGTLYTVTANDPGQSTWFGGSGDNYLKLGALPTYYEGGGGVDTLEITRSMTFKATTLSGVEKLIVDNTYSANLSALTAGLSVTLLSRVGGKNTVLGTQGTDKIVGGAGTDTINGGFGKDVLTGGGSNDRFVFNTKIGASNVDTITDFTRYHDIIQLDNAVMSGLGHTTGRLSNAAFYAHAGANHGHDKSDRIILDTSSGKLYYDSNGSHSGGVTQIAQLTPHLVLDAGSFQII